jgi:hypothetical protein
MPEMTTDPVAAYFDDAHRQWQHLLANLGDKQDLERRWQEYLHDADRDRMKYTARSKWQTTSRFIR